MADWWSPLGQARARLPSDFRSELGAPSVPVAGGAPGSTSPEQWCVTRTFALNETAQLLQLNLAGQSDHCMVWSENSNQGAGRFTIRETVPLGSKVVAFDVGPGGGNQALVRGSVDIEFTATAANTVISCWVYPGDVLDRAPIQNVVQIADDGAGNPGPWVDMGHTAGGLGWPPKDRNNVTLGCGGSFDYRVLDLAGNTIISRFNRNLDGFYHPPIGRLQVRNPGGGPATLQAVATWRRTA